MKRRLLYTAVFLATFYLSMLYNYPLMRFLLAFQICLPFLLLGFLFLQRAGLKVDFHMDSGTYQKGRPIPAELLLDNRGILPLPSVKAKILVLDTLCGESQEFQVQGMADSRRSGKIRCQAFFPYCGKLSFNLKAVRIQDFLGLFSLRVKAKGKGSATILPLLYTMDITISQQTQNHPVEPVEFASHRAGDDVSEVFQVREYRGGDSLQRVHWKLSAKEDQLMVKDFSHPIGCAVLLLLDFYLPQEAEDRKLLDSFLEVAASLSFSMMEVGCMHQIIWLTPDGSHRRVFITRGEDVSLFIQELLDTSFYQEETDLLPLYRALYPGESPSTVLALDTSLVLQRNGTTVTTFPHDDLKETLEGFPLIL